MSLSGHLLQLLPCPSLPHSLTLAALPGTPGSRTAGRRQELAVQHRGCVEHGAGGGFRRLNPDLGAMWAALQGPTGASVGPGSSSAVSALTELVGPRGINEGPRSAWVFRARGLCPSYSSRPSSSRRRLLGEGAGGHRGSCDSGRAWGGRRWGRSPYSLQARQPAVSP